MARPSTSVSGAILLAQVSAYRWATPAAMTAAGELHLFSALSIGLAVFLGRALTRKGNHAITHRLGFLLGGFLFALAMLQSALVRSDIGHVIIGEFALTFFVGTILFSLSGRASIVGVLIAIAASMLFSHPIFRPSSVIRLYAQLRNPLTECPPGYRSSIAPAIRSRLTPQMLTAAASFLQATRRCEGFHLCISLPDHVWAGIAPQCRRRPDAGLHRQRRLSVAT